MPWGAGKTVQVTSSRKGAERTESTSQYGTVERKQVTLTLCAKKRTYTIDPALKLYSSEPIGGAAAAPSDPKTATGTGAQQQGKIVMTFTVKDLGAEKVGGFNARHYSIVQRMQTSGCAGDGDTTIKQEVWVAPPVELGTGCPELAQGYDMARAFSQPGCKCQVLQQGDIALFQKAMRGLRVKTVMYNGNSAEPMMTTTISKLSQAKLPDSLFALPAGYKEVSMAELQAAQQKAMVEAMTKQAGGDEGEGDDQ